MKLLQAFGAGLALTIGITACGGPNRGSLARQTVQSYWDDVGHMRLHQAYEMLTPGNRHDTSESDYESSIIGLLRQTKGLKATLGAAKVNGDLARVPVTLHSPVTSTTQRACQHLYWDSKRWLISDDSGGLSPAAECNG